MPRNKALLKKRAGGTPGGHRGPKKIVIRPFQKPPTLPANYYQETSLELLGGTVAVAFPQSSNGNNSGGNLSLQNSYQQVVNLVSHKYGPRLYKDLVATLRKACEDHVLPPNLKDHHHTDANLLGYIQAQYQKYVDYLLLCKHVFLPLDRTHAWVPATGEVTKRSSSGGNNPDSSGGGQENHPHGMGNHRSISGHHHHHKPMATMDLWQVGLMQFRRRLQDFRWDDLIYRRWWESLQKDWENTQGLDQQALLQTTLYMWQDLGVLSETLSSKLEPDLIVFFEKKSDQLKGRASGSSAGEAATMVSDDYDAVGAISYCYSKWMHVAYNWSRFLPKKTCVKLLEDHLFWPHLQNEWLLNPKHFDPILEKAFVDAAATARSPGILASPPSKGGHTAAVTSYLSTSQQLWMLAGRLSNGYKLVSEAISRYARTRGVALMNFAGGDNSNNSNSNSKNSKPHAKPTNSSVLAAKIGKQKIGALLDLQGRLQQLLGHLSNAVEHCNLKHVWEDVINPTSDNLHDDTNLVAEALAKYVDACLKDTKRNHATGPSFAKLGGGGIAGSAANTNNQQNDHWAEAVISGVFCYLQAKDTFEAFYKQDLAKRLLWNRIVSMDVERHFVSLLKAECGAGYTSKMEGMFQDMDWSRETMNRYKQSQYEQQAGGDIFAAGSPSKSSSGSNNGKMEMDMQVLTTGFWPAYAQYKKLILPRALRDPQNKFTEYYKTKYQGRRMTWQYALGHVVVRFRPKGETSGPFYELVVSLCQALVLLQFNDQNELSLGQLMNGVGLEDRGEMERLLLSLSLGKDGTRVLQKRDHDAEKGKAKRHRMNVHEDDRFRVHAGFRSNTRRIRINNILSRDTKEDREKTVKAVSRDRQYLIDAVLVRIMKARKTILHQQLIPQVMEQLKIPAQPSDLKKRIETLIEREYFERDPNDRNRYNYLA